jgi:PAS domain S-box-containing protein
VTAQRVAEEELRQSEARFRLLVENVEDYAIFMLSTDGTVQSWNAGAERINGYAEEEIVGRHFRTFYPPALQESRHPEHELVLALRDGHYEEEGWRIRKDGSRFWANVLITAVHDRDGRHVGFAKVTRDISERREAEIALRASEERFRMLVEAVTDYAIFMLDAGGHVASWNTGAQRINGYAEGEIVGRHFRAFYPPEKQEERHPEHELELAVREGRYEEEDWRVRKDGSRFWANVVITPVRDDHGQLVGFAKIVRDTSERRAMQEEREAAATALAAANARLQQAAEDQAHFLAVTAHELRTPAGVLAGSADTLREHWAELDAEDRDELLDGMRSSGVRLRRLLADLLTASRLQNSALDLTMEQVDLAQVVHTAASTARRVHPDADVVTEAVPGTLVLGDADRLAQAVDNLIGNALRHGVPPVHVTTRRVDGGTTGEGSRVEVVVTDAGSGVTQEMQDRLFARFATGRSKGGTGLGLYIVRQLARAHHGDAWYRPAPHGTPGSGEFVISLPALGTAQR